MNIVVAIVCQEFMISVYVSHHHEVVSTITLEVQIILAH